MSARSFWRDSSRCSLLTDLTSKTQSCWSSSRCSYRPTWQTDAASHDAIRDATRRDWCASAVCARAQNPNVLVKDGLLSFFKYIRLSLYYEYNLYRTLWNMGTRVATHCILTSCLNCFVKLPGLLKQQTWPRNTEASCHPELREIIHFAQNWNHERSCDQLIILAWEDQALMNMYRPQDLFMQMENCLHETHMRCINIHKQAVLYI